LVEAKETEETDSAIGDSDGCSKALSATSGRHAKQWRNSETRIALQRDSINAHHALAESAFGPARAPLDSP
jgi:hypothetical protein